MFVLVVIFLACMLLGIGSVVEETPIEEHPRIYADRAMIVVAIIGVLAGIMIPQFANLVAKAQEAGPRRIWGPFVPPCPSITGHGRVVSCRGRR